MPAQQSIGTTFHVSATLPATNTAEDFGGLDFTKVGRLIEVPDLSGKYDVAAYDDLSTGEEVKFYDILREGEGDVKCALDDGDAGQVILQAAYDGNTKAALRFTLRDETTHYYRIGLVLSNMPSDIGPGNVVFLTSSMAFDGKTIKVTG